MLRYAADENFNGDIVRGLLRRNPNLDIVRVQDVGLSGADDPTVLEWAASQGRLVVTHDVSTLSKHAFDRVASNRPMPGVFEAESTTAVASEVTAFAEIGILCQRRRSSFVPTAPTREGGSRTAVVSGFSGNNILDWERFIGYPRMYGYDRTAHAAPSRQVLR